MKLIQGWRRAGLYVPRDVQEFAGLVKPRDPEAYLERKAAEREAREERLAIQEEGKGSETAYERSKRDLARQTRARRGRGGGAGEEAGAGGPGPHAMDTRALPGPGRELALSRLALGGPPAPWQASEEAATQQQATARADAPGPRVNHQPIQEREPDGDCTDPVRAMRREAGQVPHRPIPPIQAGGPPPVGPDPGDARGDAPGDVSRLRREAEGALDQLDASPAWKGETPAAAAAGWYRLGRNFYRAGSGPHPDFGAAPPPRPPANHQGMLF